MQVIKYSVTIINSDGSVVSADDVKFTEATSVKAAAAAVALHHQRAAENVKLKELSREVL